MAILDTIIVFLISLLIGGLGIYIGALAITDTRDYTYAVFTALLGAIIWAIMGVFFGWIPFLGPLIVFLAYLAVINARYPGGWIDAVGITLIAWISILIVLYILAIIGMTEFEAAGVPGV